MIPTISTQLFCEFSVELIFIALWTSLNEIQDPIHYF
jgi:hypothetical protein